jgi:hypothetical protein
VSAATRQDGVEDIGENVQDAAESAAGALESGGGIRDQLTVGEELREIMREAALEVIVPVARRATSQAAKYAIARAPEVARETIVPKLADTLRTALEEAGGPREFAKGWLAWASGAGTGMLEKVGAGGETEPRPWRERRLPVEESIDVVVPLETAYDRFSEFEEYARIMSRGQTVDERRNERIVWERTDGVQASAVITFHRLSDRLTRVMVTYDHETQGVLEKTTSLLRAPRRGLIADLMRFKAFVELSDAETSMPDKELEQPEAEPRARKRTRARRDEDAYAGQDEMAAGEEPEGGYEQDEEESPLVHGRPVRHRPVARSRQQKTRRR